MRLIKRYTEEFANDMARTYAQNAKSSSDEEVKALWNEKIRQTEHVKKICAAGIITNIDAIKEIIDIKEKSIIYKRKIDPITFYVAECDEFPNMGFYQEGINSLDLAFKLYRKIDGSRLNGGKTLGFKLNDGSIYDGMPCPLVTGNQIDEEMVQHIDYYKNNPYVKKAIAECKAKI